MAWAHIATQPAAVARIFAAKGRPAMNPLIVHVSAFAEARAVLAIDWPGRCPAARRALLARPAHARSSSQRDHSRGRDGWPRPSHCGLPAVRSLGA